jgi:hypothetical protein
MKTYKLTFKQSKDVAWNGKIIRVSRDGNVFYVTQYYGELSVTNWLGKDVTDFRVELHDTFKEW